MRIRTKEIHRMHKRKAERWKAEHPGTAVASASARAAAAAAARPAGARAGSSTRPPRRATAPAPEA